MATHRQGLGGLVGALGATLAGAVKRGAPSNWFLRGDDAPQHRATSTRLDHPYSQSTWIFAALDFLAKPIKGADLEWLEAPDGDALPDRSVGTLREWWMEPARSKHETIPFEDFIDLSVKVRGITGRVFWILDDSWLSGNPANYNRIIVASDEQMRPLWSGGTLTGWAYGSGDQRTAFLPEQVINIKCPNPEEPDSLEGIPPWHPSRAAAESARAGSLYAKREMDQNGDRGNYVIVRGSEPTPEQMDRLRTEMREKRRAAERGEYRDSVLGGDVEVQSPSVTSVTSAFVGQMQMSREEIFVAYGVPPSMSTQQASYSVGSASDWYRLVVDGSMPEARSLARAIGRVSAYLVGARSLAAEIDGGTFRPRRGAPASVHARFDFSAHPVMTQVREGRINSAQRLWQMGVPLQTAAEYLNMGLPEVEGADVGYLPFTLAPVNQLDMFGATPAPAGAALDGNRQHELPDSADASDGYDEIAQGIRSLYGARARTRETEQRQADHERWARLDRAREGRVRTTRSGVRRLIFQARQETLEKLEANRDAVDRMAQIPEAQVRAGVVEMVFDLSAWADTLKGTVAALVGDTIRQASEEARDEVGGDFDPLTEADPEVIRELKRVENLMKDTADEVHEQIVGTLEEGLQNGETFDELTDRVRSEFNGISRVKAETIARTETGVGYETARHNTFRKGGIGFKRWLSGGEDGVTRATHIAANGQRRAMNELFQVGAAELMHPHDRVNGAGHPEELINCRCVLIADTGDE